MSEPRDTKRTVTTGIRRPSKQPFGGAGGRVLAATGLGLALAVAVPGAATATAAHDFMFRAGDACTFKLGVDFDGAGNFQPRVTQDLKGRTRIVSAGTGSALTFTNDVTGKHVSFTSNGAVEIKETTPDGNTILTLNGHNAVFMSRTDVPAGPSATLYTGQVVIKVEAGSKFTVQGSSGTAVDICAAVS
jgi:hypothetical protein